ncbi:hypothetical protein DICVIV_02480 [Dictyocaulus viviparus]|uniref:Uncharacterized protein n=1 Tax=Dictyocaulus viviparus TaxID=29172 RepID=A0A0D8Y9W9_DICVI|nr:hypothetical protein DICVIV_02480 [Dictyocaulus viviparus]
MNFSDEAAAQYVEISAQPPMKSSTKHRHSVHASVDHQLQVHPPNYMKVNGTHRSSSSNNCKDERNKNSDNPNSNKFLKWLGIGGNDKKDLKHRRMSTFT